MGLEGISKALKEGKCRLYGCRESSGVRVVKIESERGLRGYGAQVTIEEALFAADEDYLSDGRFRGDQRHYLNGETYPFSQLDRLIYRYHILTACWNGDQFLCELFGFVQPLAAAVDGSPIGHRVKRIGCGPSFTEAIANMLHAEPHELMD